MKTMVLSGNLEILTALRMAGFQGIYCETMEELMKEYTTALSQDDIGIIVLTQKEHKRLQEEDSFRDSWKKLPIVVTIPEGEGFDDKNFLLRRVKEAIGVKLD